MNRCSDPGWLFNKDMNIKKLAIIIIFFFALLGINSISSEPISSKKLYSIASFSTSVADQDENVKRNIRIACDKLNGLDFQQKSIFSFNNIVGEGSAKNGFVDGRVLYQDSIQFEPGGGLCQVSSTLFNALLMAGCSIIERHRHYQPVTYVPIGLDATIKYGKKDLRMKNPYNNSLWLEVTMNDKSLMVVIKAEKKLPYRFDLYTEEEEVPVPLVKDPDRIRQGMSVYVYRRKYIENKLIESFLLYKDYYPPVYIK